MMFSKACEYGIRATIYISSQSLENKPSSLKEIANEIGSPAPFTAKILQQLAKNNILYSVMGPTGGFLIEKDKVKKVMLSHIVDVLEGDAIYKNCGLGLLRCNSLKPCPLHRDFAVIRDHLKEMLTTTSLFDLTVNLNDGETLLKR
jgi:Rrf2 family protein